MRQKKQAKMFSLVAAWQSSEQSKRAFCKAHRLNPTSFHYWIQKYNLSVEQEASQSDSPFVALSVSQSPITTGLAKESTTNSIELNYPNGVHLRINGTLNISQISSLIKLSL